MRSVKMEVHHTFVSFQNHTYEVAVYSTYEVPFMNELVWRKPIHTKHFLTQVVDFLNLQFNLLPEEYLTLDFVYLLEQYKTEEIDEEIFYTAPQLQQMVSPYRVKRKISNAEDLLWPGGIVYYEFDDTHSKLSD